MRRGSSGKVVCHICRKWVERDQPVVLDGRHVHVDHCFAAALARISKALDGGRDFLNFAVKTAFAVGKAAS